jgi:hypothetical protein
MNIKRRINTLSKIISAREFVGWAGVFWHILSRICRISIYFNKKYGSKVQLFVSEKYLHKVRIYLKINYQAKIDTFKHYQNTDNLKKNDASIWVFWQKGEQNVPELIKLCLDSIRKYSTGHKVMILTEKNVDNYCEIPGYIWDKYKKGILPIQQLANIIRFALLCENGGLWLDSTFYVAREIPQFIFEMPWWVEKGTKHVFTCDSIGYFGLSGFAAQKGNIVPEYMKTMFLEYWKRENKLIEYFLMDAWFHLGYTSVYEIKKLIDAVPFNNPHVSELRKLQNKPFDELKWQNMTKDGLAFFKMNWRYPPKNIPGSFYDFMKKQVYNA